MADEDLSNSWRNVDDPVAAAVLTDRRARRWLDPFFETPRTMSEVARLTALKLNVVHYHVNRMVRLDLLRPVGSRKGKGRAATLYGPTAEAFFVPFDATPHLSLEDMLHHLGALDVFVESAARTLGEVADEWGVLIGHQPGKGVGELLAPLDENGRPQPIPPGEWLRHDFPALLEAESFLRLDPQTAKEFQRDMMELLRSYEARANPSGQSYMAILGLSPTRDG